jgi:hypothetical protein
MKKFLGILSLILGLYGLIAVLLRTLDPDWINNSQWLYLSSCYFQFSFFREIWVVGGNSISPDVTDRGYTLFTKTI